MKKITNSEQEPESINDFDSENIKNNKTNNIKYNNNKPGKKIDYSLKKKVTFKDTSI